MKKLIFLFSPLLYIISFIFPKNKKIWVYGAWFGQRYSDNSKDLFEYANSLENSEIQHYWIYKNPLLKKVIKDKGYKCASAYSLKGMLIQLRAKVFITCINSSDFVPFLISPRNYFVQLWHGSPIKYIGVDARKSKIKKMIDVLRFKIIDNYSLLVSPSDLFDKVYQSAACVKDKKRIFRGGYPRNENLIKDFDQKIKIRNYFDLKPDEKLISYLPTHRNEGKGANSFKIFLESLISKNEVLNKIKVKIVVKPHFYEKDNLNEIKEVSNLLIRYELPFDLYEFLGATDMLITDYSSVMFDYELLGKKIIVFPFDYKEYTTKDRGLYFDYNFIYKNVLNTRKVDSIDHLLEELGNNDIDMLNKSKSLFNVPLSEYSKNIYSRIIKDISL